MEKQQRIARGQIIRMSYEDDGVVIKVVVQPENEPNVLQGKFPPDVLVVTDLSPIGNALLSMSRGEDRRVWIRGNSTFPDHEEHIFVLEDEE